MLKCVCFKFLAYLFVIKAADLQNILENHSSGGQLLSTSKRYTARKLCSAYVRPILCFLFPYSLLIIYK